MILQLNLLINLVYKKEIMIPEFVEKYINGADKEWKWEWIKEWDNIVVDYIWRLEDWTVFDTSIESIAKACDKYS